VPAAAPAFGNDREPSLLSDRVQRALVPGYRPSLRLTWRAMLAAILAGGLLLGLLAAGARETIAATASLLAASKQTTEEAPKQTAIDEGTGTNLVARAFKITALELARVVGDVGPLLRTNTAENLQRFLAQAGFDPQLPGRGMFFSYAGGLMVRGTAEEIARVEKTLAGQISTSVWAPVASSGMDALAQAGTTPWGPADRAQSSPVSNPDSTTLLTRTFKVDTNEFIQGLESLESSAGTNLSVALHSLFTSLGVDLQPPKSIFLSERNGLMLVRATARDLDIVEQVIQVLNQPAQQVNIRAKFVEMPNDQVPALLGDITITTNREEASTGILTAPQARRLFKQLEQTKGVEILTAPDVTTVSGRQAQLQTVEIRTIVTGAVPVVTNGVTTNIFQTSALPYGPSLDVVPYVAADGYTVQLTLIPTVSEFLGYEKPDPALLQFASSNSVSKELPLPYYRMRHATTSVAVWDGQTVMIGGMASETVRHNPDGTESRKASPELDKIKQLFVFITPTLIDPAGNRIHTDDQRPPEKPDAPRPGR
jgi:type II secretory pathway component GspD/PulD (secretin)